MINSGTIKNELEKLIVDEEKGYKRYAKLIELLEATLNRDRSGFYPPWNKYERRAVKDIIKKLKIIRKQEFEHQTILEDLLEEYWYGI